MGLARPLAGVGVHTNQILRAMAVERPDCRFTVFVPPGVPGEATSSIAYRPLPDLPFIGRHVQWPARLRRLKPSVFFGAVGALPLMNVGSPSVIAVHGIAIYRNAGWVQQRQPLSPRGLVVSSWAGPIYVAAVSSFA